MLDYLSIQLAIAAGSIIEVSSEGSLGRQVRYCQVGRAKLVLLLRAGAAADFSSYTGIRMARRRLPRLLDLGSRGAGLGTWLCTSIMRIS